MAKFHCRNCKEEYPDILGAISCSCIKKVKWNNPTARGSEERLIPHRSLIVPDNLLHYETKRHREAIRNQR